MKTKMIVISFDLERAKRIQEGKEEGKIVNGSEEDARIICWDAKCTKFPLIALVTRGNSEIVNMYSSNGYIGTNKYDPSNLALLVPEYTQYKDGDILVSENKNPFIFKNINDNNKCDYYAGINDSYNLIFKESGTWCDLSEIGGYANEEDRQFLINALQDSKEPLAKEYLNKFFGIKKEEFQPFDKVLVRMGEGELWEASLFSNVTKNNKKYPYLTVGGVEYGECISYNDETKHLLGTTQNYNK